MRYQNVYFIIFIGYCKSQDQGYFLKYTSQLLIIEDGGKLKISRYTFIHKNFHFIMVFKLIYHIAYEALKSVDGLIANRTNGAFYMSVAFKEGVLNDRQTLPIEIEQVRTHVEGLVNQPGVELDKRFVYYLLGSTGICVVPLSSFATEMQGFRTTILEKDEDKFRMIFEKMAESIRQYLAST